MKATGKENNMTHENDTDVEKKESMQPETSRQEEETQQDKASKHKKDKKIKVHESELNELRAKAQKLDELQETFVRRVADFENAKKRLVREKEDFAKFANEKIITAFLPVLDNLERALQHGSNTETVEGVLSGVSLIKKQIMEVLENNGLVRVEAEGKEFDPHVHEAMGTIETTDHPDDFVAEEIQCGYMLKDKLLRPSWVRVAKNPESGLESDTAESTPEQETSVHGQDDIRDNDHKKTETEANNSPESGDSK